MNPCPACNGTGTVVNLGVPEECPMCYDEWTNMNSVERDYYIGIIPPDQPESMEEKK